MNYKQKTLLTLIQLQKKKNISNHIKNTMRQYPHSVLQTIQIYSPKNGLRNYNTIHTKSL